MFDPLQNMQDALDHYEERPNLEVPDYTPPGKPAWLFDFCVDVCGHEDLAPQPHYEFINFLEEHLGDCQFSGTKRRSLLVEMPRGNFKTTITAEDLPVGVLTKNPNARILITTHKDNISSKRLNAVKHHFEKNAKFSELFGDDWAPEFREGVWSSKAIEVARRTKTLREPSVEVGAVGADTTGSHYDLIIADDLVQDKNVGTAEQRDKVHEYITSLFSLLDPGGLLIIIGTRWHPDDAYGKIITKDEERVKAGLDPLYIKYIRSCYDGPNGLYFPTQYGHEELDDLKERMSAARFSANYLNKPVADEDIVFKPEFKVERDFTFYLTRERSGGVVRWDDSQLPVDVTMAWDTAGTKATNKSDYHGFTVKGVDFQGYEWALVAEEFKGAVSQVISRAVSHILAFRPRLLILESVGSFELWKEKVETACARYGVSISIVEAKHGGIPKVERIAMVEPKWSNRRIIMRKDQLAFDKQISNFSMSNNLTHDDILDSWSMHEGYEEQADEVVQIIRNNPIDEEYLKRKNRSVGPHILDRLRAKRRSTF